MRYSKSRVFKHAQNNSHHAQPIQTLPRGEENIKKIEEKQGHMTSKQTKTIPEYNKIKWTWYLFRPHGLVEPNTYSSGLGLNYYVVTVIIIH